MGTLKNLVIAVTSDIDKKQNGQIRKWVENNDGKYVTKPSKGLTHLICSEAMWKKESAIVEQAKNLKANIVTFDWLEDSLRTKRKKAERQYLLSKLEKTWRREKKIEKRLATGDELKFEDGCKKAQDDIGSGGGFFSSSLKDLAEMRKKREENKAKKASTLGIASLTNLWDITPTEVGSVSSPSTAAASPPQIIVTPPTPRTPDPIPEIIITPPSPEHTTSPSVSNFLSPSSVPVITSTPAQVVSGDVNEADAEGFRPTKLTDLYHIYLDSYGFEYKILLTRGDLRHNLISRYNLRIYESHTKPHVYCTFIQFTPARCLPPTLPSTAPEPKVKDEKDLPAHFSGASTTVPDSAVKSETVDEKKPDLSLPAPSAPAPIPTPEGFKRLIAPANSSFDHAFAAFRAAFQHLTLLAWEERRSDKAFIIQRAVATGLEPFVYNRPKLGLPIGAMPQGPIEEIKGFEDMKEGLVGMDVKLEWKEGAIGREVARMEEEKIKKEWEAKEKVEQEKRDAKKRAAIILEDGIWVAKSNRFAKRPFYDFAM